MAPILPFVPLIAAGIGAATTIAAIATRPSAPQAPATPQQQTDTRVQSALTANAAAQAQATALMKRRGMASTILTSPMGISSSTSGQKSTLGG